MNLIYAISELAQYDPDIEWMHEEDFPLVHEGDRVQWEVYELSVIRCEGCYEQTCDFLPSTSVADVLRAMDAAAKALNDYLSAREIQQ